MPRYTVRLSLRAQRWLLSFIADLASKNPSAARDILLRLEALKEGLAQFPEMTERGSMPGMRRVVMRPLILTTRMREDVIEIAAIRHERQQPPSTTHPTAKK
jgi:plasmid stabilization system protein ParE